MFPELAAPCSKLNSQRHQIQFDLSQIHHKSSYVYKACYVGLLKYLKLAQTDPNALSACTVSQL